MLHDFKFTRKLEIEQEDPFLPTQKLTPIRLICVTWCCGTSEILFIYNN